MSDGLAEIHSARSKRSRRSRMRSHNASSKQQEEESEECSEPESRGLSDFDASLEEEKPQINAWEVPLPDDAPPESKDPRFSANVPAIWTRRVPMAGRVTGRSETAGVAIFGH